MKRILCSILTVMLLVSMFVPATYAAKKDYSHIVREVDNTNTDIKALVDKAIKQVEKLEREKGKKAEMEINKIIVNLIKDTNKIAAKMIKDGAKAGVMVICEYDLYIIGGRPVLIDPLRVVDF